VPLAAADGQFYPLTDENVRTRRYPLTRFITVCVNKPPGRPLSPATVEFLRFLPSAGGWPYRDSEADLRERIIMNLEVLVDRMRKLAASSEHTGGADPSVAALARSLADLGQMAAAVAEQVLRIEERLARLERTLTVTKPRPSSPSRSPDEGA